MLQIMTNQDAMTAGIDTVLAVRSGSCSTVAPLGTNDVSAG